MGDDVPDDADATHDPEARPSPETRGRRSWRIAARFLVAASAAWVGAALFGFEFGPMVWLLALTPWSVVLIGVALRAAVVARAPGAILSAMAASLGLAWVMLPLLISMPTFTGSDTVLTVVNLNMRYGHADADAVVALVRDREVDVLALEELTPDAVDALKAAGLLAVMPYELVEPREGFTGTGLYSRKPFLETKVLDGMTSVAVAATIESQGGELTVVAAHPMAPGLLDHSAWSSDFDILAEFADENRGPLLIAGDFNATLEHSGVQMLERHGLVDAADLARAPFVPTFPVVGPLPPLVVIDHVMVRYTVLVARHVDAVTVPGTDHRAFIVNYGGP